MKNFLFRICHLANLPLLLIVLLIGLNSCKSALNKSRTSKQNLAGDDFLYQYSIIDALMAGVFDGDLTIGKLKEKGDFGIGTFNKVDGELIMHQNRVYKVSYNGRFGRHRTRIVRRPHL